MIVGSTNEVSNMCSQEIDHAHINGGCGGVCYSTQLSTIFQLYRWWKRGYTGGENHRPAASH